MKTQRLQLATLTLICALGAGCAAYRTESNVGTAPAATAGTAPGAAAATVAPAKVQISETDLGGRSFKEIGPIEISVKKLTVFHKDPTREQADEALREKAAAMGADAVIRVTYKSGIGFTTWGYIDAKGTAVKLSN